jgi:hypothetical protein
MNLDTFISETLKSIIKGVLDSQEFAQQSGARINPARNSVPNTKVVFYGKSETARLITTIEFDVAITVSNQQESGASGGIQVYALHIGGKHSDKELNQIVSRIKFEIDVALPNVIA